MTFHCFVVFIQLRPEPFHSPLITPLVKQKSTEGVQTNTLFANWFRDARLGMQSMGGLVSYFEIKLRGLIYGP